MKPKSAICVASAVLILASACGGATSSSSRGGTINPGSGTKRLTIGAIGKDPLYWAYFGADALGYFAKNRVKFGSPTVVNDPQCMRALVGGGVDVCFVGLDAVIKATQAGSPVRVIGTLTDPTIEAFTVRKGTTWTNLKGKAVATQTPTSASTAEFLSVAAKHGLKPSDFTLLTVGQSAPRFATLKAGKAAVALTSQPSMFIAADAGYPTLGTALEGTPSAEYIVSVPGKSAAKDASLARMLKAMQQADEWLANPSHKNAAIALWAKLFDSMKGSKKYASESYDLQVEQGHMTANGIKVRPTSLSRVEQMLSKYAGLKVTVSNAKLVDGRYVKAALAK